MKLTKQEYNQKRGFDFQKILFHRPNSSSSSSSSSSSWSINSLEVDGLQEQIDRGNRRESEKEEEEKRKLEKKPVPDFLQPLYEEKNDLDDTQIDESETKTNTIPKTRFVFSSPRFFLIFSLFYQKQEFLKVLLTQFQKISGKT